MAKCASCGAEILWHRSATTNNFMPIDALPAEDGNIIIEDGMAHVIRGMLWEESHDGPRYKSHFATCPNHEKHRKVRNKPPDGPQGRSN